MSMGSTEQAASFVDGLWPEARVVADPDMRLYRDFSIERGGLAEMFGPRAFACGVRTTLRGHTIGRKVGDGWTLPTYLVVDRGRILWRFDGEHAGDRPDLARVPEEAGL